MRGYLVFNFNFPEMEKRRLQKYGIANSERRKSVENIVAAGKDNIISVEVFWNLYDAAAGFTPANEKVAGELSTVLSRLDDIEKDSVRARFFGDFELSNFAYKAKPNSK